MDLDAAGSRRVVLHLFSGDLWAGAEAMLFHLLKNLSETERIGVVALALNEGILTQRLRAIGIETHVVSEGRYSTGQIFLRARTLLAPKPIALIHAHGYKENLLALLLSWALGVRRRITTLHGMPEPFSGLVGWKAVAVARLNIFLMRRFFSVVAVSEEMRTRLVQQHRFDPSRVTMIHNGVDLPDPPVQKEEAMRGDPPAPFHIGTVGRMVRVKDYDLFLEVAAEIGRSSPHVRFSLLGDGPLKAHLVERAAALGLAKTVQFLDAQPDPLPYYRSLDLYLNTSIHEGIPMSLLEAMGCGVPVIAPRVGGIPEMVTHGQEGFLVDRREKGLFARHALSLIEAPSLRASLAERARRRVAADFGASGMASKYAALYKTV